MHEKPALFEWPVPNPQDWVFWGCRAMHLVRGYMEAFGLNQDELYTACTKNPARVVGLELN